MKSVRRLSLIAALFCTLLAGGPATSALSPNERGGAGLAGVGGTFDSGIKIQNLSSTEATVLPTLYNETYPLSTPLTLDASVVAPGGSVEYWLPGLSEVPSGKYSIVVFSDQPIASVATHTNYPVGIADSYNGVGAGATTLYIPYVYRGLNDWFTDITVQNCDPTTTAHVSLTVRGGGLTFPPYGPVAIEPSQAYTFETSAAEFSNLGSAFMGSATVTSTEAVDLAGEVNEIRVAGSTHVMTSFRTLTSADAGSLMLLPSLYRQFGNLWRSGIQIQNTSDSATATVDITFRSDPGEVAGGPWHKTGVTIDPQEAYQFYLPGDPVDEGGTLPDGFKGSATIEASGAAVSAMVIHTNYPADVAEGYIGIPPSAATSHLSAPSLYKNFGAGTYIWRSGIKVQNVDPSNPVTVTFTFSPDPGNPGGGTLSNVSIDPGSAFEMYLPGTALDGAVLLADGFKGSAVIEVVGTGAIVGTVIHTNYGRGVANMYGAINYTP